jgi:hypothetical protein
VYHRCLQLHSQTQRRSCHAAGEDPMGIFDGFSMVFPLVCVVVSFCWFVHDSLRDAKVSPVPLSLKQPDNHSDSVQNPEVHIIQYISLYISIYISIYIYQYIYIYISLYPENSVENPTWKLAGAGAHAYSKPSQSRAGSSTPGGIGNAMYQLFGRKSYELLTDTNTYIIVYSLYNIINIHMFYLLAE